MTTNAIANNSNVDKGLVVLGADVSELELVVEIGNMEKLPNIAGYGN